MFFKQKKNCYYIILTENSSTLGKMVNDFACATTTNYSQDRRENKTENDVVDVWPLQTKQQLQF